MQSCGIYENNCVLDSIDSEPSHEHFLLEMNLLMLPAVLTSSKLLTTVRSHLSIFALEVASTMSPMNTDTLATTRASSSIGISTSSSRTTGSTASGEWLLCSVCACFYGNRVFWHWRGLDFSEVKSGKQQSTGNHLWICRFRAIVARILEPFECVLEKMWMMN